jgi:hypothetical protein
MENYFPFIRCGLIDPCFGEKAYSPDRMKDDLSKDYRTYDLMISFVDIMSSHLEIS